MRYSKRITYAISNNDNAVPLMTDARCRNAKRHGRNAARMGLEVRPYCTLLISLHDHRLASERGEVCKKLFT